jgi:hypothetical protein
MDVTGASPLRCFIPRLADPRQVVRIVKEVIVKELALPLNRSPFPARRERLIVGMLASHLPATSHPHKGADAEV